MSQGTSFPTTTPYYQTTTDSTTGTTAGTYTITPYAPPSSTSPLYTTSTWSTLQQYFSDLQFRTIKKLIQRALNAALSKGWECPKCQAVWAPTQVGCDLCNLADRLDGVKA